MTPKNVGLGTAYNMHSVKYPNPNSDDRLGAVVRYCRFRELERMAGGCRESPPHPTASEYYYYSSTPNSRDYQNPAC